MRKAAESRIEGDRQESEAHSAHTTHRTTHAPHLLSRVLVKREREQQQTKAEIPRQARPDAGVVTGVLSPTRVMHLKQLNLMAASSGQFILKRQKEVRQTWALSSAC